MLAVDNSPAGRRKRRHDDLSPLEMTHYEANKRLAYTSCWVGLRDRGADKMFATIGEQWGAEARRGAGTKRTGQPDPAFLINANQCTNII